MKRICLKKGISPTIKKGQWLKVSSLKQGSTKVKGHPAFNYTREKITVKNKVGTDESNNTKEEK